MVCAIVQSNYNVNRQCLPTKMGVMEMEYPLRTALRSEVQKIIHNHINCLSAYAVLVETEAADETNEIIQQLESLAQICGYSPESCTLATYEEAIQSLVTLDEFLRVTNQQKDSAFYRTSIGQIYTQAERWCSAAGQQFNASVDKVWELIDPVVPDCLSEIQCCLYEAKWWKPVPLMDIEILKRTVGVTVYGDIYELGDLPKGIAVRFSINLAGTNASKSVS